MARKTYPIVDGKKECSRCGKEKPIEEFPWRTKAKKSRETFCQPCKTAGRKRWLIQHPEKRRQYKRQYYGHATVKLIQKATERRKKNPEPFRRARRAWHARNPAWRIQWDTDHADLLRHYVERRRGRKLGVPQIDVVDLDVLYERYHGLCSLCHEPVPRDEATQDHIIPLTKPGSEESYANSALAHRRCNSRKGNKIDVQQLRAYYKGDPNTMKLYLPGPQQFSLL